MAYGTFTPPDQQDRRRRYRLAFSSGVPYENSPGVGTMPQGGGGWRPATGPVPPYSGGRDGGVSLNDQALALINPQLQAAADAINRRSALGSQAISALTSVYGRGMSADANLGVGFYGPEQGIAKKVAEGSRDYLTAAGKSSGKAYAEDLAQAGQVGPGDINLKQIGKGAGGAAYGTGIAELDALIARKLSAQTEAALEPSFAAGMGQMQQGLLGAQLARQLADEQGQITAQVPGILDTLTQRQLAASADQRDYAERVREYNQSRSDATARQKASMAGPNAPTLAGRQAYWDSVAADRTKSTGVQYVGTTTGIRPVDANPRQAGIQPAYTLQGRAAQQAGIKTQAQITNDQNRTRIAQQNANTSARNASTSARRAGIAQTAENDRHAENVRRLNIAGQNAKTAAQRAAIAQRQAAETARHHRETERISRMKKKPAAGSSASGL